MFALLSLLLLVFSLTTFCCQSLVGPQQIHLAATHNVNEMIVNWASNESCSNSTLVYYGQSSSLLNNIAYGFCWNFTYGNPNGIQYLHQVLLSNLSELTRYYYQVESSHIKSSDIFYFKTLSSNNKWVPNLMIFGDLGHNGNNLSHLLFTALPSMIKQVESNNVDLAIHMGDFAYDMHDDGGERGDHFFRMIQPIAAYTPYMTCVGNHEPAFNFSHYRNRFHMPGSDINDGFDMWYSFNIGQIHFVFFSTEVIFDRPQDMNNQYNWIENDLMIANQNRDKQPWIITIGHRPMYCSNMDQDCIVQHSAGEQVKNYLEYLFFKYGVDIQLYGHEHSYERTYPVYDFVTYSKNYTDPRAPIHLISGAAGCNEDDGLCINPIERPKGEWSAFRTQGIFHPYSYGFLRAYNSTHLYFNQINGQLNEIYDEIWIIQHNHGPFTSI